MKKMKELKEIIEDTLDVKIKTQELHDLDDLLNSKNDFTFEVDGGEYRFISDNLIEDIYHDEQIDLIEEVFLGGKELPSWIEIDWDKTINNVFISEDTVTIFQVTMALKKLLITTMKRGIYLE